MEPSPLDASRTLFDLSQEILALHERLEALGGDVTSPDVEHTLDEWFARLGEERDQKLDHYAALIRELEARSEARREESRRLAERARRDADEAAYLKQRLVGFFREHGLRTVETRRYRLTVQQAGGRPPVVLKVDPEALPEAYQRWKVSADLDALHDALERGETLPYATLGERSTTLRIL